MVFRFIVCIVIHTDHNRDVLTLRGGGDDHFFRTASGDMLLGIFPLREETRGFNNNIHTEFAPR